MKSFTVASVAVLLIAACTGAQAARRMLGHDPMLARRMLQQIADEANAQPEQILPAPGVTQCYSISDRVMTPGKLCTSQLVKQNVTKVICDDFKPECVKTVEETHLLVPHGTATSNPDDFNMSVDAACKLLGYRTFGGGSVHMTGDSPASKTTCWNGQAWVTDNWWVQLVCCN